MKSNNENARRRIRLRKDKLVPDVTGGPNDNLTGELEHWETSVIKVASYFTVVKMSGPSRNERKVIVYRTFLEAHQVAGDDQQSLIYAVAKEGRWCCVVRELYRDVCIAWHELHPAGLEPHVFEAEGAWFSYTDGRTTGPWPSDAQAYMVGQVLAMLPIWDKHTPEDRQILRRTIERLNVKLVEQLRAPITIPES